MMTMISARSSVSRYAIAIVAAAACLIGVGVPHAVARAEPPPRPAARLSDFNRGQIDYTRRVIWLKPGEVPRKPAPVLWTYRWLLAGPAIEISTPG